MSVTGNGNNSADSKVSEDDGEALQKKIMERLESVTSTNSRFV